ncbi:UbiA prenyltransferase family-domain-containing protein [Mycena metata]|uniref:4-hydroxybenzoate polyprenyltransferase, mitochondrial n=1 Tax=Mycena metata TaxID=1033252 RepID=A0AAD7NUV9_9AGAR|nr:UbiA prenyltransferase family-domain-containing protein [Mycena metata]
MAGESTPLFATKSTPSPPATWYNYYELTRLHKFPLGSILVFWPSAWGLTMAAYSVRLPVHSLIIQTIMFAIGSTLLHTAACILNDICDRDFDRKVERTKNRPLATGIISVSGATLWLLLFVVASIALLATANRTAFLVGLIGVFPLHALYPLMKRWTWWPQAWLGLAMNWGFPVAWISVTGTLNKEIVGIFFVGTICWTIVYDTIYGCQDVRDDAAAGVKSTSLLFGSWVRPILCVFAVVFVAAVTWAGILNHQGVSFFAISVGGACAFFLWQFLTWKVEDVDDCGRKFEANGNMGVILWAGMLLDYYFKVR